MLQYISFYGYPHDIPHQAVFRRTMTGDDLYRYIIVNYNIVYQRDDHIVFLHPAFCPLREQAEDALLRKE